MTSKLENLSHEGGCHCGAVRFSFTAPEAVDVTECDCSICTMTAYQHVFIPQGDVHFTVGKEHLSLYTFGTGTAQHLFCKICGIKPLYIPRSHPECYSINLRCVTPATLKVGRRIAFSGQDWENNIAELRSKS